MRDESVKHGYFPSYKHTAAIRAALIKNYKPVTVNRVLYALLRLLKEALRLEVNLTRRLRSCCGHREYEGNKGVKGRSIKPGRD